MGNRRARRQRPRREEEPLRRFDRGGLTVARLPYAAHGERPLILSDVVRTVPRIDGTLRRAGFIFVVAPFGTGYLCDPNPTSGSGPDSDVCEPAHILKVDVCGPAHIQNPQRVAQNADVCQPAHTCARRGSCASDPTELPPVGRTPRKGVHCRIPNQNALADRPFVQSVDLETEAIVGRGRVLRERDRFL